MSRDLTIFGRSYRPPSIEGGVVERQQGIRARSLLVRQGHREQPRRWGLFPRAPIPLTPEERLAELERLVQDYEGLLTHLRTTQQAYDRFLDQLGQGVAQGVRQLAAEIRSLEQERQQLVARTGQDAGLLEQAASHEANLVAMAGTLAQATLLILRKIDLSRQALRQLAEDQGAQRAVLERLVGRLQAQRDSLRLGQRIRQLGQKVAQLTDLALNFEEALQDVFGPLQGLLREVTRVDDQLFRAVEEIRLITESLSGSRQALTQAGLDGEDPVLEFLVRSELAPDRIAGLLEARPGEPLPEVHTPPSVAQALSNLELLLELTQGHAHEGLAEEVEGPEAGSQDVVAVGWELLSPRRREADLTEIPTDLNWIRLPAGRFQMGSLRTEAGRQEDETLHEVELTQPCELAATPVTQAQWQARMGNNPARFRSPDRPVEQVSWYDAIAFCNALSREAGLPEAYVLTQEQGRPGEPGYTATVRFQGLTTPGYRLPTEAEWEYACRAGDVRATYNGDLDPGHLADEQPHPVLDPIAWWAGNACGQSHPVGQLRPNTRGLYDLLGNVWEWCWDWQGPYLVRACDPTGPPQGARRVIRGGSWGNQARCARAANRRGEVPDCRRFNLGFRPARTLR